MRPLFSEFHSPGLPLHAIHTEGLPPRVQQGHLLLDLELLLIGQSALRHQLVPSLQDTPHAALVCSQLHHESLAKDTVVSGEALIAK